MGQCKIGPTQFFKQIDFLKKLDVDESIHLIFKFECKVDTKTSLILILKIIIFFAN